MKRDNQKGPVGVIGLGFMGSALAGRLLESGYAVTGFDLDAAKIKLLTAQGVRAAASIPDVVKSCECVVVAVYDTPQVIDVVEGAGGFAAAAAGGRRTVICVTTCEPDAIAALAGRVASAGIALIEFPLSGNSAQVRSGEALGLVAGDNEALTRVDPVMRVLCPRRIDIGRPGDAARAKLAINLVLQLNRCALAEGLVLATCLGLDPAAFLKVLAASPAHSDVMEAKGDKMVRGDYAPQSRIAQTLKDAQLILEEARRRGQPLPLMDVNAALLAATIRLGGSDRDSSAIIEAIRARR